MTELIPELILNRLILARWLDFVNICFFSFSFVSRFFLFFLPAVQISTILINNLCDFLLSSHMYYFYMN